MRRCRPSIVGRACIATLAVLATACATRTEPVTTRPASSGVAPALVVERFLHAVSARDYDTMAHLFGTRDGSILKKDSQSLVEKRMFALASLLRHDDYALEGETVAPGRNGEAIQIVVRMQLGEREVPVPFTVVRTRSAGWLVEQIDVEAITARR